MASGHPSVSAHGRYVAFESADSHLVGAVTNGLSDVFVHDNITGTTERTSTTNGGGEANGASAQPSISSDGRFVAFTSAATNLVADGSDGSDATNTDVFVKDRRTGDVSLVSVRDDESSIADPASSPVISGDGRSVAFATQSIRQIVDPPVVAAIPFGPFVRHLDVGTTVIMEGTSLTGYVVVTSFDLSDDGSVIVYNEVDVPRAFLGSTFVGNAVTGAQNGTIEHHPVSPSGPFPPTAVAVSADGKRFAVAANPTSTTGDAAMSVGSTSDPTHPTTTFRLGITAGVFLASDGTTLGAQTTIFGGPAAVVWPVGGGSGTIVSWTADGRRLVPTTQAAMSADGSWFAFVSGDDHLVSDDTNGVADVFTRASGQRPAPPT